MSKKRKSPEGSDSVFQQNAKRAKLRPLNDTTLQDLPIELIEFILIKAVTMEVKGMRLAKSVWKERADLVISRLTTVCPQWSNILTTNFFRKELHRTLDAEKSIRLEILLKSCRRCFVSEAITFKDELFILCIRQHENYYAIHVYDRNDVAKWKDVIPLPGIHPKVLVACSVSNCLYMLKNESHNLSVIRITKNNGHQFIVSPLITDMQRQYDTLCVAANGSLILSWQNRSEQRAVISVYGANGSLQYETWLSSDIYMFSKIIPKSNGNLILVSSNDQWQTKLTEIDKDGTVIRQYQSSLSAFRGVCNADIYGHILISEQLNRMELLDSEFNILDFTGQQQLNMEHLDFFHELHYNSERNEVVTVFDYMSGGVIFIFRFIEE